MTQQSIRSDFHSFVAETVANEILTRRSNYYYFLGKVDRWPGEEDVPPTEVLGQTQLVDDIIRGEMLYLKKIAPSDVTLVVKRYEWEEGFVYRQWDHTKDLKDQPFYCVNSEFNVYKCLHNSENSPSMIEPTGQSFFPFKTSDGYIWKYMYNVPTFKRAKFSSIEYMPVQKAISDSFYNDGSIDDVVVINGGEGYSDVQLTAVTVSGITTGAGAAASLTVDISGKISSVVITNQGSDYIKGAKIEVVSSTGSGAVLTPVISAGEIVGVTIEDGGIGYLASDTIEFRVGGAIIVPHVSRETGEILGTTIVDSGAGYLVFPQLTVIDVDGINTGTGKYGNPHAILTAVEFEGKIVNVTIEDPGINYRADTNTQIVVQGDGEDASFTPVVYNGEIIDVIVENKGKNYTFAVSNIIGAGTGASLAISVSASNFSSNQSVVEQTTIPGAIYSIVVTEPGESYSPFTTTVRIEGNGSGCIASPIVVDGKLDRIEVTEYGQGFNYAKVYIEDSSRPTTLGLKDAEAYAILSPSNGHGFNAPRELKANTVAINSTLIRSGDLTVIDQDYRKFGLIRNPNRFNSVKRYSGEEALIVYDFSLNTTENLSIDETLVNGLNKYKVVAIKDSSRVLLQQIGESLTVPSGSLVPEVEDGRVYNIIRVEAIPSVNRFSGDLLYVSYENPFTFTEGQIVTVKTFIRL